MVAISAVNVCVSSRQDCCNSLYQALSKGNLRRLQCVQDALGQVVMGLYTGSLLKRELLSKLQGLFTNIWILVIQNASVKIKNTTHPVSISHMLLL